MINNRRPDCFRRPRSRLSAAKNEKREISSIHEKYSLTIWMESFPFSSFFTADFTAAAVVFLFSPPYEDVRRWIYERERGNRLNGVPAQQHKVKGILKVGLFPFLFIFVSRRRLSSSPSMDYVANTAYSVTAFYYYYYVVSVPISRPHWLSSLLSLEIPSLNFMNVTKRIRFFDAIRDQQFHDPLS